MRNIVLIGDVETLIPFAEALARDGFHSEVRSALAEGPLPDGTGLAVLHLAALGEDPVSLTLLNTADASGAVPVIGLATPAQIEAFDPIRDLDDYVPLGSDPAELIARVRRVIWRQDRVDPRNVLTAGDLTMDLANYTVQISGRPVDLTYKEYELLRFLATNRDRVFSREALLSKVWGYDFYGGARTVDVHVRRLRSKIENANRTFIETVRNVGYRFRAQP